MGEMVQFPFAGGTTGGYLSEPKYGIGPGVVVIEEWWGLVDHIKDVCDRFAEEGFVALARDLYHGKSCPSPDEAGQQMIAMRIDEAERYFSTAVGYLATIESTTREKAGVLGFCMGGVLALLSLTTHTKDGARLVFYARHPSVKPYLP